MSYRPQLSNASRPLTFTVPATNERGEVERMTANNRAHSARYL